MPHPLGIRAISTDASHAASHAEQLRRVRPGFRHVPRLMWSVDEVLGAAAAREHATPLLSNESLLRLYHNAALVPPSEEKLTKLREELMPLVTLMQCMRDIAQDAPSLPPVVAVKRHPPAAPADDGTLPLSPEQLAEEVGDRLRAGYIVV